MNVLESLQNKRELTSNDKAQDFASTDMILHFHGRIFPIATHVMNKSIDFSLKRMLHLIKKDNHFNLSPSFFKKLLPTIERFKISYTLDQ